MKLGDRFVRELTARFAEIQAQLVGRSCRAFLCVATRYQSFPLFPEFYQRLHVQRDK